MHKTKTTARPKAVASGKLRFGSLEVDCYVLDNGQRVISQKGILGVLTGHKRGGWDQYLSKLPEKYGAIKGVTSISFDSPNGLAVGRDAMFLVDLCGWA